MTSTASLPEGVVRVSDWQAVHGHPHAPRMLDVSARTAQEAADGLGVQLGQIAKSVIFRRKEDDAAVLVIASGDRRVDEKKSPPSWARSGARTPISSRSAPDFQSAVSRPWRTGRCP